MMQMERTSEIRSHNLLFMSVLFCGALFWLSECELLIPFLAVRKSKCILYSFSINFHQFLAHSTISISGIFLFFMESQIVMFSFSHFGNHFVTDMYTASFTLQPKLSDPWNWCRYSTSELLAMAASNWPIYPVSFGY